MTAAPTDDQRSHVLEAYLTQRQGDGYRIETRTGMQAVICRQHRFHFVLRWIARSNARQRLVISVDQDGAVTSVPAEAVRW